MVRRNHQLWPHRVRVLAGWLAALERPDTRRWVRSVPEHACVRSHQDLGGEVEVESLDGWAFLSS